MLKQPLPRPPTDSGAHHVSAEALLGKQRVLFPNVNFAYVER